MIAHARRILSEILRNKFSGVVQDMRATLVNTACSPAISESKECAAALFTESGSLVATDNPLYLCALAETAARVLDDFQFELTAEDIVVTNDPYSGGTRVQDFTLVAPLGHEDEIVSYLAVRARMADVGGEVLGGCNPRATEVWAEGARFTPVKLYRDGRLQKDVLATIALNSRAPEAFKLDLEAMLGALNVGRQRLAELVRRYGARDVQQAMEWAIEYAERRFQAEIRGWPEGAHHGTSRLTHDGHGRRELVVRATVRCGQGWLEVDLSESDEQSTGFVNSTAATAYGFALLPILSAIDDSVPKNAGVLRRIKLITRKGTLVDAEFPSPTGWSPHHVGAEVAGAVASALEKILPTRAGSVSANMPLVQTIERAVRHGGTIEQVEVRGYDIFCRGGCSGTEGCDGWGMPGTFAASPLPSVEMYEAQFRGGIERMELVIDSGGPGCWRGGLGTETMIRFPDDRCDLFLSVCVEPAAADADGFVGGRPGSSTEVRVLTGGQRHLIRDTLIDERIAPGTEVCLRMGGGAGWGPAWERDPRLVLADVLDGCVSVEAAARDYGVVIDGARAAVDVEATRKARALPPSGHERAAGRS